MDNYVSSEKIGTFRSKMKEKGLDAFFLIHGDSHKNEYPEPCDQRMAYMCGFNGSFGICAVTMDTCTLWTHKGYEIQAQIQIEKDWELIVLGAPNSMTMAQYFNSKADDIKTIGFDAYTTTIVDVKNLSSQIDSSFQLCPQNESIVDAIWGAEKPHQKFNSIDCHPMEFAGVDTKTKVENIKKAIKSEKTNSLFTGIVEEIAWVLNFRGSDLIHTPVFYSYMFMTEDSKKVYINKEAITDNAYQSLKENGFEVKNYSEVMNDLKKYSEEMGEEMILMDQNTSYAFYQIFDPSHVKVQASPIGLMKCVKNPAEIEGMKKAHLKDAVAMCNFLCWLDKVTEDGSVFSMDESDLKDKVDGMRAQMDGYKSAAFRTISASGEHGAMTHYNFTPKSEYNLDTSIKPKMYLVDSGGQYVEGTTDITRTTHLGEPTDYEKLCYTLVLKGHIAFSSTIFPPNTKGPAIDAMSKKPLWKYGLICFHGTGHGVGAGLNVHEGPISANHLLVEPAITTSLEPGMIISNEPGNYQQENDFGIRIENMVTVTNTDTQYKHSGLQFYKFETITLVPIETKLIDFSLMKKSEIDWLNNYHQKIWEKVVPMFKEEEKKKNCDYSEVIDWLFKKTQNVGA